MLSDEQIDWVEDNNNKLVKMPKLGKYEEAEYKAAAKYVVDILKYAMEKDKDLQKVLSGGKTQLEYLLARLACLMYGMDNNGESKESDGIIEDLKTSRDAAKIKSNPVVKKFTGRFTNWLSRHNGFYKRKALMGTSGWDDCNTIQGVNTSKGFKEATPKFAKLKY